MRKINKINIGVCNDITYAMLEDSLPAKPSSAVKQYFANITYPSFEITGQIHRMIDKLYGLYLLNYQASRKK